MPDRKSVRAGLAYGLLLLVPELGLSIGDAVQPVHEAAFSLRPETGAGTLRAPAPLWGVGWVGPLAGPAGASDEWSGVHGAIAVNRYTVTEGGVAFVPVSDGWATFTLGPQAPKTESGRLFSGELAILAVSAEGTRIANGHFAGRVGDAPLGWSWQGEPGAMREVAWPEGTQASVLVAPPHAAIQQRIRLEAGRPTHIRFAVRALSPPDFTPMARLPQRDTPAHTAVRSFRRGVNLGNHLEAPPGEDWGAHYTAADFDAIRDEGFDHVRLPVAWHHEMGSAPEFTIDPTRFERVDALVKLALERGLAVIVNWHHFNDFTDQPSAHLDAFERGWAQIAGHFADAPGRLALELLNEPRDAAEPFTMNAVYARVLPTLRKISPTRILFVGPGRFNRAEELPALRLPPDDDRLIVTVHHYEPYLFTHQGAHWTLPLSATTGVRFPGPPGTPLAPDAQTAARARWTRSWFQAYSHLPEPLNPVSGAKITRALRLARAWSDHYGRPVHIGEWGCITEADPASRARYHAEMRLQLDALELPWALWDWKAHFRYWDDSQGQPMHGLRDALFGESPFTGRHP